MGLSVYLEVTKPVDVFDQNITHNLGKMAQEAGIYMHLWRPEEIGIKQARQLIDPLTDAVARMKADPEKFKRYDSPNGWGMYKNFLPWVERYLAACTEHPLATVRAER